MKRPLCPDCATPMRRNGTTSAGRTRWRCPGPGCGRSKTVRRSREDEYFAQFLAWLFSKQSQDEFSPQTSRSLRNHIGRFWQHWPTSPLIDEIHDYIFVDGIHLGRSCVVLIAMDDAHVLGWYTARAETTRAWEALFARIAPPLVVVCDGGQGIRRAVRDTWPGTRVQRCLVHVQRDVFTAATHRPKLAAGQGLFRLGCSLTRIRTIADMSSWLGTYSRWESKWHDFLEETSVYASGDEMLTHQRLVGIKGSLDRLVRERTMFTFLDPSIPAAGPVPSTNNKIENFNGQLRCLLRSHRGLSLIKRVKAIHWYCAAHADNVLTPRDLLKESITDAQVGRLYRQAWERSP